MISATLSLFDRKTLTLALLGLCLVSSSTMAQSTWTGTNGTSWADAGNWTGGVPTTGTILNFGGAPTNLPTSMDISGLTTGAINFTNNGTAGQTAGYTLGASGQSITLGGNITTTAPATGGVSIQDTINLDLILNANRIINVGRNGTAGLNHSLIINGAISGDFGITKNGAANLTLSSNSSSFTGALTIDGNNDVNVSSLQPNGSNSSIGAGTVINLTNGNLNVNGNVAATGNINRTINLASGGTGRIRNDNATAANSFVFNGTVNNTGSSGTTTFELGGANGGANEFRGALTNGTGTNVLSFVKGGSGSWTLSGNNTYTGQTNIDAGTLNISALADSANTSNLGYGALIRLGFGNGGGTLNYTGAGSTTARQIQLGAFNNTNGSGGGAIANNAVNGGTGLRFTATNFNKNDLAAPGTATNRTFTLGGSNTDANEITGIIANGATSNLTTILAKDGFGRWILSGPNTFTGATSVNGGVLQLNNATALPGGIGTSGGTGALTLNGGILGLGDGDFTRALGTGAGQVALTGANGGFAAYGADRFVNLGGSGATVTWITGGFFNSGSNSMRLSHATATHTIDFRNPIDLNGFGRTIDVGDGAATNDAILSGAISGNATLTKAGAGVLVLSGANNYVGGLNLQQGTVKFGASGVLPDANAIQMGVNASTSGTTIDLNGFSETIGAVAMGGAGGANNPTAAGLTHSIINSGASTAILTLGGTVTYNTGVANQNGQATISANIDLSSSVTAGNREFAVGNSTGAAIDLLVSGNISDTGAATGLFKNGPGFMKISGTNSWNGTTFLREGTLQLGSSSAFSGAALTFQTGSLAANTTDPILDLNGFNATVNGVINMGEGTSAVGNLQSRIIDTAGGGLLTLSGGGVTYNAGSVANANGQAIISANVFTNNANRNFTIANSSNATDELVISGAISGSGILTKAGAGTLLLSGANTYSGQLNIETGTVKLGANDTLPNAATNIIQMGINASTTNVVLDLNGSSDTVGPLRMNGASGQNPSTAGLTHSIIDSAGGGVLTLGDSFNVFAGGANQYGQATISASLNTGASARNLTVEDSAAAVLDLLISGTIVGTNGFNKAGAGTLALSAANTFTGVTRPGVGVLMLQNNLALQNSPVNLETATTGTISLDTGITSPTFGGLRGSRDLGSVITSGYGTVTGITLNPGMGSTSTYNGVISNGAAGMGLTKSGAGTQVLAGVNTYTGATNVNAGTLQVGVAGVGSTHADSALSLNGTAATTILAGTGTVGGDVTVTAGTIAPGDSGGSGYGLLNLGKDLTLTGGSILDFQIGGLATGNYDALGVGAALTYGGALNLNFASAFNNLDAWNLFDFASHSGSFSSIAFSGSYTGSLTNGGSGVWTGVLGAQDFTFTESTGVLSIGVIPEPSRAMLLLLGLLSLGFRRRRAV